MNPKKTEVLDVEVFRGLFPELTEQPNCVVASLVSGFVEVFSQLISDVENNAFSITYCEKVTNFAMDIVYKKEIVRCFVQKESIGSGKYPVHVNRALSFSGSSTVVNSLLKVVQKFIAEKTLSYWTSCGKSMFTKQEDLEALQKEVREFYNI